MAIRFVPTSLPPPDDGKRLEAFEPVIEAPEPEAAPGAVEEPKPERPAHLAPDLFEAALREHERLKESSKRAPPFEMVLKAIERDIAERAAKFGVKKELQGIAVPPVVAYELDQAAHDLGKAAGELRIALDDEMAWKRFDNFASRFDQKKLQTLFEINKLPLEPKLVSFSRLVAAVEKVHGKPHATENLLVAIDRLQRSKEFVEVVRDLVGGPFDPDSAQRAQEVLGTAGAAAAFVAAGEMLTPSRILALPLPFEMLPDGERRPFIDEVTLIPNRSVDVMRRLMPELPYELAATLHFHLSSAMEAPLSAKLLGAVRQVMAVIGKMAEPTVDAVHQELEQNVQNGQLDKMFLDDPRFVEVMLRVLA